MAGKCADIGAKSVLYKHCDLSIRMMSCQSGIQEIYLPHMKSYYVYILASERNGTLYTGITSNLIKRIWEHKSKAISGLT